MIHLYVLIPLPKAYTLTSKLPWKIYKTIEQTLKEIEYRRVSLEAQARRKKRAIQQAHLRLQHPPSMQRNETYSLIYMW